MVRARKKNPNFGKNFHPIYRSAFDLNEDRVRYSLGLKRHQIDIDESDDNTYVCTISFWQN